MQNSQNKNTKLLKCEIKLYQQHPEKLHKDENDDRDVKKLKLRQNSDIKRQNSPKN